MKRFILTLLAAMLLCGCNAEPNETTEQTIDPFPSAPIQSLYDPDHTIEEQTQGAVKAFSLSGHTVSGIRFWEDRMLVFTMDEQVELTTILLLRGDEPGITHRVTLDCALHPDNITISTDGKALAYYNYQENSIVLLDQALAESRRIRLPDQVTGQPVLSSNLKTLYYSTNNEIYALDMKTGLSRLLKQHSCISQSLSALHFDDTVLEVFLTREDGNSLVVFISTENGETLGSDNALLTISSEKDRYFLRRLDSTVTETLLGKLGGSIQAMDCEAGETAYPAFSIGGLVGVLGSRVRLYDLDTGIIRAEIDLGNQVRVLQALSGPSANVLWLQVLDQQTDTPLLLRWDLSTSGTDRSDTFIHDRYTAAQPDTEGLSRCQERADAIGQAWSVKILLGGDFPLPQGYGYTQEYQVQALTDSLNQLEQALSPLPLEFMKGLGTVNKSGVLRIVLVRDILDIGGKSTSDMGGLHYVSAGDHYILLTVGPELETAALHQICHVLDSYVYGHTSDYDLWDSLNPKGFSYTGSYAVEAKPEDPNLQGSTQCFISAYSLSFAREDRATLFVAAMTPDNEAQFSASQLQNKLRYMCTAIRKAYNWNKTQIVLPWEQYLTNQ